MLAQNKNGEGGGYEDGCQSFLLTWLGRPSAADIQGSAMRAGSHHLQCRRPSRQKPTLYSHSLWRQRLGAGFRGIILS
jgi:hypothetical protein